MTSATPTAAPIRAAVAGDWNAIAALLGASALPLDGAREHVEQFVVAEREGTIVGCAAIERHGDVGLLRSVAVRDSDRNSGLGIALVERCIDRTPSLGISTLVLLTTTADRFFLRFGFRVVEQRSVPDAVRASAEFRGVCPASAIAMQLDLPRPKSHPADAASKASAIRPGKSRP